MEKQLAGYEVKIPPPHKLPNKMRKALRAEQEEMLDAWERVKVIPPGGSPGNW